MLRDDAITLLADRMQRSDITTRLQNEMQVAQSKLELMPFLPWFLLTELATGATIANEERVALPADFLREPDEDEATLWLVDNTTSPAKKSFLNKSTYALLVDKYKNSIYQQPLEYALVGQYFRLRPIPDTVYTVQFLYYAAGVVLSSNIENVWLKYAPELLIARTGMLAAKYPNDQVRFQQFQMDYNDALNQLKIADTARREAALERIMGDSDA